MNRPTEERILVEKPVRAVQCRWAKPLLLCALFGAWLMPGLFGRDPWKADEAYSFGLVLNMVETGDWVVPTLGGEPFMQKPPLLYVVAAGTAKMFSPWLPLHEGARVAVLLFNLLTLVSLGLAGRELQGPGKGWLAPVLLIACLGLVHIAHMLMTDQALLSGFALGHYGLALAMRRRWLGGALAGTGVGMAFLAKGLLGLGLLGLTAAGLPLLFRTWRTRNYLCTLLALGLASLPWLIVWPAVLHAQSPELFRTWFWDNNFGRFFGLNRLGPKRVPFFYFGVLPWFALPALPLALWAWWRRRRGLWQHWETQLCLLSFVVMLAVLSIAQSARSLYAQPMLVPLALAGAAVVDRLPKWLSCWINRVSLSLFGLLLLAGWLAWIGLLAQQPAWAWGKVQATVPGFDLQFLPNLFAAALAATALCVWRALKADGREGRNVLVNWAAAVACIYLLGMTLFLPLCNAHMTYRPLFVSLRSTLPADAGPVASQGLGEPQRALLHYYAGLKTRRVELHPEAISQSSYLLIQRHHRRTVRQAPPAGESWQSIWEGRHGSRESYGLYRRTSGSQVPRTN